MIVPEIFNAFRIHQLDDKTIRSGFDQISLDDLTLGEVFEKIFDKEKGKTSISHKSEAEDLRNHFESIWEDYNDEEVKDHDIKKIFQWYNALIEAGILKKEEKPKKAPKKKKVEKKKAEVKEKNKPRPVFKIGDRVRLIDGKAVGSIDSLEKNKAIVNYGIFTTNVAVDQLELVERKT